MARSLKNRIDASVGQLQKGLTFLASTGATAPFIGLFGTVWGIYHALIAISSSGSAQIDQVAGPIGEALIMTAFGPSRCNAMARVMECAATSRSQCQARIRLDPLARIWFNVSLQYGVGVDPFAFAAMGTSKASWRYFG